MTTETLDLPGLFSDRKGRNLVADLELLISYLRGRGWRTARDIAAHPELRFVDRYTRTLAEHSAGAIIGSDQGYKLTAEASPEELNEWKGRYQSQIRRMTERLISTERAWHSRRAA
jgi:hypothetical protein